MAKQPPVPTLAQAVAQLEDRAVDMAAMCGEIIATLKLNHKHLFKDDPPAKVILLGLIEKWDRRWRELTA